MVKNRNILVAVLGLSPQILTETLYALVEEQKNEILAGDEELKKNWDEEFGDRLNQIVFIGKSLDQNKIKSELELLLDSKAIA